MSFPLSLSSKAINKDIKNYSINKLLNIPKKGENLFLSPNISKAKYNSAFNKDNEISPKQNKIKKIIEQVEQYQMHPFRRINMKILGEGIKQKLIEMNEDNSFEKEKTMSSPDSRTIKSKLIFPKLSNKNNNFLRLSNKDLNSSVRNVKSLVVEKPDFNFFAKGINERKELGKNKSCDNLNNLNIKEIEKGEKNIQNSDKEVSFKNFDSNISKKSGPNRIKELKYRRLKKIKIVYDSIDDYDIDEDISDLIINPETKFILFFDLLIIIFYLYTFLIITIDLAKTKCFCPLDKKIAINDIIFFFNDILYILDLIISFFRGYYNFEYKLIKKHSLIIKNYLAGDFLIDLLEAVPIFSIKKYICMYNYEYNYNSCYIYRMSSRFITLKILSYLKVFKLMKILSKKKNKALYNFYELISENYNIERTTKLIINAMIFFIIIHCFVCLHIFIGKNTYSNWLLSTNSQDESLGYIYIKSLYFLVTTLTTVGYGDITCQSLGETIFQIILLAVGTIFYSYIISTIGNFIKNDSHAKIQCDNDLNILENIRISYPNMPYKLYKNIKTYLLSKSTSQEKYDVNILIGTLPFTLKNSILFTMYKTCIKNFKFFKKNDNSEFIATILTNFIPVVSKKNEFLIYEGQIVEEIIFIKDGRIGLNAAIDLENPSNSINRYFNENFKAFTSDEEKKLFGSRLNDGPWNNNTMYASNMNASITYDTAQRKINKAFETIGIGKNSNDKSLLHFNNVGEKSEVYQDAKFDVNGGVIRNEDGNYQYLKILDIRKNEHFGCVFMTLKDPCPLTLQVKSKFAELYLLKKEEAISTSKSYPNIWKKLYGREFHNLKSIKDRTFKCLAKYIEVNQLLINYKLSDAITKNDITINDLNILEKSICAEKSLCLHHHQIPKRNIKSSQQNKFARFKTINNEFDKKAKRLSLGLIVVQKDKKNVKKKTFKKSNSIIYNNLNKRNILRLNSSGNYPSTKRIKPKVVQFLDRSTNSKDSPKDNLYHESSSSLFVRKESTELYHSNRTDENSLRDKKEIKKSKLKKLKSLLISLQKQLKIKQYNESENKYSKSNYHIQKRCFKRISEPRNFKSQESLQSQPNLNRKSMDSKINNFKINKIQNAINENTTNNTSKNNVNDSLIKELETFCEKEVNFSFCSINEEKNFNADEFEISKGGNLEILSSYANLNQLSSGKYISNLNLQNQIKDFFKKFFNIASSNESLSLKSISFNSDDGKNEREGEESKKSKKKIHIKKDKHQKISEIYMSETKDEIKKKKRKKSKKNIDKKSDKKSEKNYKKGLKTYKATNRLKNEKSKAFALQEKKNIRNCSSMKNRTPKNNICVSSNKNSLNLASKNEEKGNIEKNNSVKVNKSDQNSSFSKKNKNKKIYKKDFINPSFQKFGHIYNKNEEEFELDNAYNNNTVIINQTYNNSNNNINYNNYNNIYNDKNLYYKKIYQNNKNQNKNNRNIINHIFPQPNIITNNITTITNNIEDKNIFNTNEKINNIETSFNINNVMNNNLNIIYNKDKNSERNISNSFCNIY